MKSKINNLYFYVLGLFPILPLNAKNIITFFAIVIIVVNLKRTKRSLFKIIPFVFFVTLYFLSLLFTDFPKEATNKVIRMLPMIFIPISFYALQGQISTVNMKTFYKMFMCSTISYFILVLVYFAMHYPMSLYTFYSYIENEFFFRDGLIYTSLNIILSVIILFHFITQKYFNKTYTYILLYIILLAFIFFLDRRISIMIFLLISLYFFLNYFKINKILIWSLAIIMVFCSFMFTRLYDVVNIQNTFRDETNSIGIRYILWYYSFEINHTSFLFGNGLGSSKTLLAQKLSEENFGELSQQKLNFHNQFIETFFELGFVGLVSLLGLLTTMFFYLKKNKTALFILIIFIIFMCTESIFDRQNGVLVFSIFTILLLNNENTNNRTISKSNNWFKHCESKIVRKFNSKRI